jgi:hypothetical protein
MIKDLDTSLSKTKRMLALKEVELFAVHTESSRYRDLWMSESRLTALLTRLVMLPDTAIGGISHARDDDRSSPSDGASPPDKAIGGVSHARDDDRSSPSYGASLTDKAIGGISPARDDDRSSPSYGASEIINSE